MPVVSTLPFALFTMSKLRWGLLSEPTPEVLSRLSDPASEHYRAMRYTYFIQYHLHKQLLMVGLGIEDNMAGDRG